MSAADQRKPQQSSWRLVIAGTGGQGVISAARLLAGFFLLRGHHVVSAQLHGMAQRGGAVQSCVMVDTGISPVMAQGAADVVLGLEPVETARTLPLLSPKTFVLMNSAAIVPFSLSQAYVLGKGSGKYPELEQLAEVIRAATPRLHVVDASALAKRAGQIKTLNVVMLGCLFGAGLLPARPQEFVDTVMARVPPKLAATNGRAFRLGVELGEGLGCLEEAQ
jgi:indolepyruvate ferredoxin oxidoreductase beta subunit